MEHQVKFFQEMEESMPVCTQKMKEYHKCLEEISCLRTQLASSTMDYENILNERNNIKRSAGQLELENNRLKSQVIDLNRQVQVLLREVEEARGDFVPLRAASEDMSFSDDTTANKVISRHLVTFRNIMELQMKNQQLLSVLRQLSEEQEKQLPSEKTKQLEKELENAYAKFEELNNKCISPEVINNIVKQRDMFRLLLSHHGVSESILGNPKAVFPLKPDRLFFTPSPRGDQNMRSSMQQMQAEFDQYRKEKDENERLLKEQLQKARDEIFNLRLEYLRSRTQTREKYESELLLHAQNVQELANLKAEHQKCLEKEAALDSLARKAEAALYEHKKSWAERETAFHSEQALLQQRNKHLEAQTTSLMRQVELRETQLKALQIKSFPSLPSAMPDIVLRDTQHLLDIIKYIKKENETISSEVNSTQFENVHLKLKVEQLSSDLKELQVEYTELQNVSQMKVMSETQHPELLDKIEMLNDSNNLLCMEKTQLMQCKEELEEKLKRSLQQVQPLNDHNKAMSLKLETVTAEKEALECAVKSWQSRCNQLLEQPHRIGPQEYKTLTSEMEELKNQKFCLTVELQGKQLEMLKMGSNLEVVRNDYYKKVLEYEKLNENNIEREKAMIQVKMIGHKYKSQYDELKVLYDALVVKANESAISEQTIQELQNKIQGMEKAIKDSNADKENLKKQIEQMCALALEKDSKTKNLFRKVNAQKNAMSKERDDLKSENTSLKAATEDASFRSANQKTKFEDKISKLETAIKTLQKNIDHFARKNDELSLKLAQQEQIRAIRPTAMDKERCSKLSLASDKTLSTTMRQSGSVLRLAPHITSPPTTSQIRMAALVPKAHSKIHDVKSTPTSVIVPAQSFRPKLKRNTEDRLENPDRTSTPKRMRNVLEDVTKLPEQFILEPSRNVPDSQSAKSNESVESVASTTPKHLSVKKNP